MPLVSRSDCHHRPRAVQGWEKRIADDRKWEGERKARKGTGTGDGDYTSPFANGPVDASTSSTAKKQGSAEEEEPAEVLSEAARAARAKDMEGDINAWRASTADKVAEGIQAGEREFDQILILASHV